MRVTSLYVGPACLSGPVRWLWDLISLFPTVVYLSALALAIGSVFVARQRPAEPKNSLHPEAFSIVVSFFAQAQHFAELRCAVPSDRSCSETALSIS